MLLLKQLDAAGLLCVQRGGLWIIFLQQELTFVQQTVLHSRIREGGTYKISSKACLAGEKLQIWP